MINIYKEIYLYTVTGDHGNIKYKYVRTYILEYFRKMRREKCTGRHLRENRVVLICGQRLAPRVF